MGCTCSNSVIIYYDTVYYANIIKRAMKYNRKRINYLMKNTHLSDKVLIAYKCIYMYTDDCDDFKAITYNSIHISELYEYISSVKDSFESDYLKKYINIIEYGRDNDWSSKKIMKELYKIIDIRDIHLLWDYNA